MSLTFPESSLPRLDRPDKRRLLLALQRDIPTIFFCTWCSKLQRLNPGLNWRSQDHCRRSLCGFSEWAPESMWRNHHFVRRQHIIFSVDWQKFKAFGHICFMDAHLIMNRHFYGPLHGISLRHLTRRVSYETELELESCSHDLLQRDIHRRKPETAEKPTFDWIPTEQPRRSGVWRFSLRYIPKIIDDKLYLARSFKFVGPNVPWGYLARLMDSIKPKVCVHMRCSIVMDPAAPMYSPTMSCGYAGEFDFEFSPAIKNSWRACGFNPGTGSCLLCKTDYDVSLTQHFLEGEWRFSCNTYHCLGQCQTITDPFWDSFALEADRRIRLPLYGEGRAFTDDGNDMVFGHPSTNGEARRKWLENATEGEIL